MFTLHSSCTLKANAPSRVWLFHCHIEWHIESGLIATMIEAPAQIPSYQRPISQDFLDACKAYPLLSKGNAAGNVINPLDLNGSTTELLSGGIG